MGSEMCIRDRVQSGLAMYTPELERRVVWRVVDLAQGIIISSYEYIVAATTTEQSSHNKQQANHDHHVSQNTDEDEAATAAAAVVVAVRAPSPQTNELRIAKETPVETATGSKGNKSTCYSSGSWTPSDRFITTNSFESCMCMWCFQPQRRRPIALFA